MKNQYGLSYNDIATAFKKLPPNKNSKLNHSEFRIFLEKVVTQQAKLHPLIKKAQNAGESSGAKAKKAKEGKYFNVNLLNFFSLKFFFLM